MKEEETRHTVLVVEDDQLIRKAMISFLKSCGHRLLEAEDGRQGLHMLRQGHPDILVTDLRMPEMDGRALVDTCLKEFPRTEIIVVSGMGSMQDAIEILRLGAFDYITKPVVDMELVDHSIRKALQHAELKRGAENRQAELEDLVLQRTEELHEQNQQLSLEMKKRRVQEKLVLQAKQEWERTVDAMPDTIVLLDGEHNVIRSNLAGGYHSGDSSNGVGSSLRFHCYHCENNLSEQCPHFKTMADGQEHTVGFFDPRLDAYVDVTTVPYTDPDGTLLGSVYIARDVTARKNQQEEYERLFESSLDAITVTTQNGFVDCNKAALKLFGYAAKEDFLRLHPADVSPEKQPDGELSSEAARRYIAEAMEGKGTFFEWQHRRKDGSLFPAEVLLSPFISKDEMVVQGVVRDLTERHLVEKEQERLQSRLLHAQKLESVGQLAAGIAHEINTPTQFIGTNIDFIEDAVADLNDFVVSVKGIMGKAPEGIRETLETALEDVDWDFLVEELPLAVSQSREGVRRVASIVQAMKEFSHPGSKEMEPHDLNQIVRTTVTVARNEWKYVSEVDLDLDPDLPQIQLLGDEMGQVILNMLVNAAHAIAEKLGDNPEGKKGSISITTRMVNDQVEMCLSDSGAGMPEDVKARIFDPFYTTKAVGKGTGQGLAIAHDVVDKHGGSITVESRQGQGTTFRIIIPRG
jgi:PAS domain S-box-containing protein